MSENVLAVSPEEQNLPVAGEALERLENFHVIQNERLRLVFAWIPGLLLLLILLDWLVGQGNFSRDTFRMTTVLTIALLLFVMKLLFDWLPRALEIIWRRDLIDTHSQPANPGAFIKYLDQFENALNSRYALIPAVVLAIGAVLSTYPFRYFFAYGHLPYDGRSMLLYFFGSQADIITPILGFLVGILAWRVGIIAFYIGKIGERFPLKIQVNHPDKCGGLKPLGDLALNLAVIILIPSIFLSIWGFINSISKDPSLQVYVVLWSGYFRQLLVLLSILSLFAFIQPLYKIHLSMETNARKIQSELDLLGQSIETASFELRTQAHTLSSQQVEEKLRSIEFMKKVYEENSRIPTWPFDWKTFAQFTGAQVIPLLSLLGTSGPIIDLVRNLFSFGR